MPATPELANRLKQYVSGGSGSVPGAEDAFIEACIAEAAALVDHLVGTSVALVPTEVLHRAYVETGAELFHRKAAPQGITQFASVDGAAIRTRRDPLEAVRPMLTPFLPGGFA